MPSIFSNCFNLILREERYTNKFCDFCNKRIILNDEMIIIFKFLV